MGKYLIILKFFALFFQLQIALLLMDAINCVRGITFSESALRREGDGFDSRPLTMLKDVESLTYYCYVR